MAHLTAIYAFFGCFAMGLSLFWGPHFRYLGLINLRNIFVIGFIYFQFYGVIYPLWHNDFGEYLVVTPERTAGRFVAYSLLFLVPFFLVYNATLKKRVRSPKPPAFRADPGGTYLIVIALTLGVVAYVGRFSGFIPIIGPMLNHVLTGAASATCCLAVYVIVRNLHQLPLVAISFAVILLGMFNAIVADFSRRNLVGISAACLWGLYFVRPTALKSVKLWVVAAPLAIVAITLVGAFSQIRADREIRGQGAARIQGIIDSVSVGAFTSLFALPDTGIATLWLIDSRFDDFEYDHLFMGRYIVLHIVPRQWLDDKPKPLSHRIPTEAGKRGVDLSFHTVGPGIIGHAAADGGYYAALLYGILMGWVIACLDGILARNMRSPFAVACMGNTLGHMLGLSRGESSIFLGLILIGIFSNLLIFYAIDRVLRDRYPIRWDYALPPHRPAVTGYA